MDKSTRSSAPAAPRTRYEDDFYTWVEEQVELLRSGRLDEIDASNIAEELGDVGRSERRALESAIAVLTMHLLKWDHQPTHRTRSWEAMMREQRRRIDRSLQESPGLASKLEESVAEGYAGGRDRAVGDTNLEYETFPESCPWSFDEMMTREILYQPLTKLAKRPKR